MTRALALAALLWASSALALPTLVTGYPVRNTSATGGNLSVNLPVVAASKVLVALASTAGTSGTPAHVLTGGPSWGSPLCAVSPPTSANSRTTVWAASSGAGVSAGTLVTLSGNTANIGSLFTVYAFDAAALPTLCATAGGDSSTMSVGLTAAATDSYLMGFFMMWDFGTPTLPPSGYTVLNHFIGDLSRHVELRLTAATTASTLYTMTTALGGVTIWDAVQVEVSAGEGGGEPPAATARGGMTGLWGEE